jgi:hypothetical protein
MSKTGERILRGAREARAYARGEITEGFVVHVPGKTGTRTTIRAKTTKRPARRSKRKPLS